MILSRTGTKKRFFTLHLQKCLVPLLQKGFSIYESIIQGFNYLYKLVTKEGVVKIMGWVLFRPVLDYFLLDKTCQVW
jgi:hypothetical protein